eukprot:Em0012g669a
MPTSQAALNVTALNAETALSNPNGLLIHRQRSTALWKQHAPQLDVRLVVLPMSQHWIVHLWAKLPLNTTSSSMSLQWNAPLQPDYVITAYTLHHRVPSLKSQSDMWGPPSTATVQFHTYNPSGILFHQINSVVTDFLGVKLHGGLPWLIFDVGSGPAVVVSNSTRTFTMVNGTLGTWYCLSRPPIPSTSPWIRCTWQPSLPTMKVYFEGFPSTTSRYGIATPYSMCLIPS